MKLFKTTYVKFFSLMLTVFFSIQSSAQTQRIKENVNNNWQYLEYNTLNIAEALSSKDWVSLNLPHTWNAFDATDNVPGYRRSSSWYKKNLRIQEVSKNALYALYFEGSNVTTKVFVNGKEAGNHIGGYIGFEIDITPFIKKGDNQIMVCVDNSFNPEIIPSQKSDFFIYGGITRDVWLLKKSKSHISNTIIRTPEVSEKKASLSVAITLDNFTKKTNKIKVQLFDPKGAMVQEKTTALSSKNLTVNFPELKKPMLWSPDTPNLYSVQVSVLDKDKLVDQIEEIVGFRWFEFKKNGPFYLNGQRLLLRGTHRHEEHAGYGAAMPNALHVKDIEDIKEMGANFIRLAHYPQDPEVYKMCDKLGILVWDELPWCRGGIGNATWKKNTKNMLTEIIEQNVNHPSIIIWSLGNEIYWLPDFENGDDENEMNTFLEELNDLAHTLDPTRKTAIRKYYPGSHIVDVFSPSIWSGWYSGSYTTYQKAINKYLKEYPHFFHAEYGGASHVGRHTYTPVDGRNVSGAASGWTEAITQTGVKNIAQIGDWSENYIVDLFDWHLMVSETSDSLVGNIQWAFKDFGTPLRPENDIPYINQKGIVDRDGNPKDAYYVFKSYWAKKPFVYIESHTWKERQGPKNTPREVSVYSNCKTVELFLNGKSLGAKNKDINKFPASGLMWEATFKEGPNVLKAVGKMENQYFEDILDISYRYKINGVANSLSMSSEVLPNGNYLVTATAKDSNGLRCLDYQDRVYFQCLSGGTLVKHMGTPTGSESIKMANGVAQIEVKPNNRKNPINVMVINQSFKGTYLKI